MEDKSGFSCTVSLLSVLSLLSLRDVEVCECGTNNFGKNAWLVRAAAVANKVAWMAIAAETLIDIMKNDNY